MALKITNPKNLSFTKNVAIKYNFNATGGKPPYSWKAMNNLPAGLELTKKGVLKGTPTKISTKTVEIRVKDSKGNVKSKNFNISIVSPTTTTTTTPTPQAGYLWAWGNNGITGNLGDGTSGTIGDPNTPYKRSSPVQTIAGGTDWVKLSLGYKSSGAIKSDGSLWIWGNNGSGQIGDNTTIDKSSPVQTIAGGNDWTDFSLGNNHSAGIKSDGTLWLWGDNVNGTLGDNTNSNKQSSPIQTIAGGNNWKQVSCGQSFTGAIKTDGTLWMWGQNNHGQLGENLNNYSYSSPVQTISGGNNWKQISCGYGVVGAIKTDGTLWMWGLNQFGQLGDNTNLIKRSSPVQTIAGGTNWVQVDVGYTHSAAIKNNGTLWCWGYNDYGQLGIDNTTEKSSPIQTIAGGTNWLKVNCGNLFTTAIKNDGTLWCWGQNIVGALGDDSDVDKSSPVQTIMGGNNWINISASDTVFAIESLPTTTTTPEPTTTAEPTTTTPEPTTTAEPTTTTPAPTTTAEPTTTTPVPSLIVSYTDNVTYTGSGTNASPFIINQTSSGYFEFTLEVISGNILNFEISLSNNAGESSSAAVNDPVHPENGYFLYYDLNTLYAYFQSFVPVQAGYTINVKSVSSGLSHGFFSIN